MHTTTIDAPVTVAHRFQVGDIVRETTSYSAPHDYEVTEVVIDKDSLDVRYKLKSVPTGEVLFGTFGLASEQMYSLAPKRRKVRFIAEIDMDDDPGVRLKLLDEMNAALGSSQFTYHVL